MSQYTTCHKCGQEGHYARQCTAQPAPLEAPRPALISTPSICLHCGKPGHQGCSARVADYPAAAADARAQLGYALDARKLTPFRAQYQLPARSDEELRAIARKQVAADRAALDVWRT